MHLPFDSQKALQAASVVALAEGRRVGKLRLLKLLYIADRRCLRETGRPLLGSKAVAMDHGPLHSDILSMMDGAHPRSSDWARHFDQTSPREFLLRRPADNSALSRYEIELLQNVVRQHEEIDDWRLSELTHEFDEWRKNWTEGTSKPIPLEDVVDAVGRGDDKDAILLDLNNDLAFDRFFERAANP